MQKKTRVRILIMAENNPFGYEDTQTIIKPKTKRPKMFKVILHNDDFTPMEFVVMILETVFHKSSEQATHIMMAVHTKGAGTCGVYTYEIAEAKVQKVKDTAFDNQHPLLCTMEPA